MGGGKERGRRRGEEERGGELEVKENEVKWW